MSQDFGQILAGGGLGPRVVGGLGLFLRCQNVKQLNYGGGS